MLLPAAILPCKGLLVVRGQALYLPGVYLLIYLPLSYIFSKAHERRLPGSLRMESSVASPVLVVLECTLSATWCERVRLGTSHACQGPW